MTISDASIEHGLQRLAALAEELSGLESEIVASATVFFAGGSAADYIGGGGEQAEMLARRRHLEWFFLERPSEVLGGVPAEALLDRWLEEDEEADGELASAFLMSLAGVFEVTGVEEGRGVWLHDLFGHGEYPIVEPEAAGELMTGDLVVGRLFAVGESLYRLSPAAASFRNAELAAALRRDMKRLQKSRRGVMRIAQSELERMFHAPDATFALAPREPRELARSALDQLVAAGLPESVVTGLLDEISAAAREPEGATAGRALVTEALNRLAFDTVVDLELARKLMFELCSAWQMQAGCADARRRTEQAAPADEVRAALERFEKRRASGHDLEKLFRGLEDDLGLDPGGESENEETAPAFPGVVGAMVAEFLWDVERERGAEEAAHYEAFKSFARFASAIGVFENLGRRDLLDFAARWLLDEKEVESAEEARVSLAALREFCRWSEERHQVPLWTSFGDTLERLEASLPRLVEARHHCVDGFDEDSMLYEYDVDGTEPVLIGADDARHSVRLDREIAALLVPGDLLFAIIPARGEARVFACYPPELAELRPSG
ncbi:MAG: hypothetical protein O7B99_14455 [Planctomycetota bacterium]|nr:hypothetical protein [Planctomycetota bacterium]